MKLSSWSPIVTTSISGLRFSRPMIILEISWNEVESPSSVSRVSYSFIAPRGVKFRVEKKRNSLLIFWLRVDWEIISVWSLESTCDACCTGAWESCIYRWNRKNWVQTDSCSRERRRVGRIKQKNVCLGYHGLDRGRGLSKNRVEYKNCELNPKGSLFDVCLDL